MSSTVVKLLFAATVCFTFVSITIALDIPNQPDAGLDENLILGLPGLGDGDLIPPVIPCLRSVTGVGVCIRDLISSILSIQLRPISTACCDAVLRVEETCWPKIFPTNPLIPVVIESICVWSQAHPFLTDSDSDSSPPPPPPSS
ncbi:hypothetical protein AAHA92_03912 [Salvia divinorum]|uniref:Prolamin-like domain-containing protein n=1 Tax=Salvia divinorum TaxID=28513 RepID=A0ABD1I0S3_SALDI